MKQLTKEDIDVVKSVIQDATTLDYSTINTVFDKYKNAIGSNRQKRGLAPFSDNDWSFIRALFNMFFECGFNTAALRISDAFKTVSDLTEDLNS